MKNIIITILFLIIPFTCSFCQERIYLWPEGAPMAKGKTDKDQPYLEVYFPKEKNAANSAVIIFPGGGYYMLADDHEGKQVAKWYNDRGITAFILYYRLGFYSSGYTHPVQLMDAARAVRTVRSKAKEYEIDANKIGILGFSAGGHLVSTIGTKYTNGDKNAKDAIERVSSRPDHLVMVYPVISFTADYTHEGSSKSLLGPEPDEKLKYELSNDLHVTQDTPPSFLVHTHEDEGVPSLNSISFYIACKKAGVPAELHIYEKGKHGLGMINAEEPVFSTWAERLEDWLKIRKAIE